MCLNIKSFLMGSVSGISTLAKYRTTRDHAPSPRRRPARDHCIDWLPMKCETRAFIATDDRHASRRPCHHSSTRRKAFGSRNPSLSSSRVGIESCRSPGSGSSTQASSGQYQVVSPPLWRSEEHTSELQSLRHLVCRLLLEKK